MASTSPPDHRTATLTGLVAVLLWSAVVGLIRSVSEHFGATGGAALIYTVASMLLSLTVGPGQLSRLPRRYLFWGAGLFVSYELCLALSIGYAHTSRQAIEVGMVNYLWPALTMVFAILFNHQHSTLLVVPGFITAITGICWVLGGEQGLDIAGMLANVGRNPLSYGLALAGSLIWATYCTVTARMAQGQNGVTLFFTLTAVTLWFKYLAGDSAPLVFSLPGTVSLVLAAAAMGFGYAAWNIGILHGNVTVLAGASYFIPVLSAVLASVVLHTTLPPSFWQGAAMVCTGSLLCGWATRRRTGPP